MGIQARQLSKYYGQHKAVDSVSFAVGLGVLGFLGPNGAGKSTTMKMLAGFIRPSAGIVRLCGYTTERNALALRRNIGYLPENNPLYRDMYVQELLQFVAHVHRLPKKKQRVAAVIEQTGLCPVQHKKIAHLSKGYQQRLGLAKALVHDPPVLILDEPTAGLDPNQLIEMRQLIHTLGKSKTIIFSTHIMQEAAAVCDNVIIIHLGKIIAEGNIPALLQQYKKSTLEQVFVHLTT